LPHAPGRSLGSVAGPVVLPVKIGPTLPAPCRRAAGQDRLPTCRAAGPVTREALPARGAAGPVVLPVKIGPTLPAPPVV